MVTEMYDAVLFDLFGTLVTDRGDAIEGAQALLDRLPPARWAIVTSCPHGLADALLRRAKLPLPGVIISAEDVSRGKPAPDGYQLAAQRLAFEAQGCLVIEDSAHGIAAGKAAGMEVINVRETPLRNLALDVAEDGRLRLRR
jgi:sugar-phosphatase